MSLLAEREGHPPESALPETPALPGHGKESGRNGWQKLSTRWLFMLAQGLRRPGGMGWNRSFLLKTKHLISFGWLLLGASCGV